MLLEAKSREDGMLLSSSAQRGMKEDAALTGPAAVAIEASAPSP